MPRIYYSKGIKSIDLKFGIKINYNLSLINGFLILYSIVTVTRYILAIDSANTSQNMEMGKPFLVEHYQINIGKPETTNNSIFLSFTGKGIINDTGNITAEGNATETLETMTHPIFKEKQSLLPMIKI